MKLVARITTRFVVIDGRTARWPGSRSRFVIGRRTVALVRVIAKQHVDKTAAVSSIGRLTRVRLPRPGRRSRRSPSPSPSQAEVVIHPHRSIVYAKRVSVPLKFGVRRVVDEARVARITRSQPLSLMDVVPLAWVTFEIRHRSPDRRPGPCHCQAARRQDRRRVFDRSSHPCPPTASGASFTAAHRHRHRRRQRGHPSRRSIV